MSSFFASYPPALNDVQRYANLAAFPSAVTAGNGALAIALDTDILYISNGTTWQVLASGAVGTVTSVAMSVPTFLSVAGSPITSSGTLAVTLSGTALPIANGGTGQTTAAAAFNALAPMTTTGDMVYDSSAAVAARLAIGSSGNVLTVSGGIPTWAPPATSGTVTSVAMSVPSFLSVAGSPITSSGTLAISLSGTALPIGNGGTGQTTASAAFNALSPITTTGDMIYSASGATNSRLAIGSTGNVLTVAGGIPTWAPPATSGTVTSVAMSVPAFLSIAGSPITGAGTLAVTLSGTALPVANGGTGLTAGTSGGVLAYTATGTLASSGALTANQVVIGGGAGVVPSSLAAGSQYQVLVMGATTPGYGAVNLAQAAAITGTLPAANVATATFTAMTVSRATSGSGTYTVPTSPRTPLYLIVELQAGASGGGASGTGGTGGTPGAGGDSTFSVHGGAAILTAKGGPANGTTAGSVGGGSASAGGTVGAPAVTIVNIAGEGGSIGYYQPGAIATSGGAPGRGVYGGGGIPQSNAAGGNAIATSGSGGAGGGGGGGALSFAGVGGSAGGYIKALITSPSASYDYAIGTGGAGGTAGTSGYAGGNGAGGVIVVWEFYQ